MIIKVPASSANIGVGFDTLGISLSLYNEFKFTRSYKDELIGFHDDVQDNLVYKAYRAFLASKAVPHHAVTIEQLTNDIPISRGLGSSASCILAGVFAANSLAKINAPFDECVAFAADLEGHPDNIYAAAYGGLNAVFVDNDEYTHQTFDVSSKLHFTVLIPEATTSTTVMRDVLPKDIPFNDAVHNVSRIVQLPDAFKTGNITKIKQVTEDTLHEPYRFSYLVNPKEVETLRLRYDLACLISGSGSALLVISLDDITPLLSNEIRSSYKVVPVSTGNNVRIDIKYHE